MAYYLSKLILDALYSASTTIEYISGDICHPMGRELCIADITIQARARYSEFIIAIDNTVII